MVLENPKAMRGKAIMGSLDLPIEFNVEVPVLPEKYRQEINQTLWDLASDHQDMTGASITLSQPAHGETPYLYRASIVVYMRPDNVYADEKSDTLEGAIKGASDSIERQVRERRDKLGEPWKRPDLSPDEAPPTNSE
jgi:ribosome-associated translation inhibitor RaiA